MDIKYKIISFHPETGNIQVNYYCDEVPDGLTYAVDIPVQDGQFASKDLIENLIKTFEPRGQLQRMAELSKAEVPDYLNKFIPAPFEIQANANIPNIKDINEAIQEALNNTTPK